MEMFFIQMSFNVFPHFVDIVDSHVFAFRALERRHVTLFMTHDSQFIIVVIDA